MGDIWCQAYYFQSKLIISIIIHDSLSWIMSGKLLNRLLLFFPKCPQPWREMKIKNSEKLVRQWEDSRVKLFLSFFPLISSYINIKCLSQNKLLCYIWYRCRSLLQTSEKPLEESVNHKQFARDHSGEMALAKGSGEAAPAMQLCCPQRGWPRKHWGDEGIDRCSVKDLCKNACCPV